MNRHAATLTFLPWLTLLPCLLLSAATATSTAPARSTATPSSTPERLTGTVSGVPTPADIEAAALRLAGAVGGVLRNCPAAYTAVGTPGKRCLGVSGDVDTVRGQLSSALGSDLYGVWRSRDDQRTVFNWIKAPSGTVYLRVAADLANPARSLVYLDAPTVAASGLNPAGKPGGSAPPATQASPKVPLSKPVPKSSAGTATVLTPSTGTMPSPTVPIPIVPSAATAPSSAQVGSVSTPPLAARSLAPLPFVRTLELRSPRLSGPDVLAAQNRLIALTTNSGPGKGDGWYGPTTARTVRAFQSANQLSATGRVDQATWDALFSSEAKGFRVER